MSGKALIVYVHGKGGSPEEAEHYKPFFPGSDLLGFDYSSQSPWEAKEEFAAFFEEKSRGYDTVTLIANSIGAYFSMNALNGKGITRAFFISPVVDMEKLISDMMIWAGVTEKELEQRGEIPTDFGETLSWEYLSYVRRNPIAWDVPTCILYGDRDNLTSPDTMTAFARRVGARLTIMEGGEHWFHTKEQMSFLDKWLVESLIDRSE